MKVIPGCSASLLELIDTCWDVNNKDIPRKALAKAELIDTCWDVNQYVSCDYGTQNARINRYMLGCKFNRGPHKNHRCIRINRYMLGCKFSFRRAL